MKTTKTQKRSSSRRRRSATKPIKAYVASIAIPKIRDTSYITILGNQREQKRSGVSIAEREGSLEISITAKDITALRASMNSIMRDIQAVEGTMNAIGQ